MPDEKFISGAIEHPGYLRRALHVPEGETIPKERVEEATHSKNVHLARAARLAQTLAKLRGHHHG